MLDFVYENATKIVFGLGCETQVGALVREYADKVLLVYGGGSAKRSGLLDRIKASLAAAGVSAAELGGVQPNPHLALVYKGIELCRRENIAFILAVGGGSCIDTAKAISLGVPYEGDVWDFFSGRPYEGSLPVGVVLTIPAAGSESSCDAVITKEEGMLKRACCWSQKLRPVFALMNPELTLGLPDWQTFCGVTDIMTHIMERYFTNTRHVDVTDRMCEGLLQSAIYAGKRLKENPADLDARSEIMWCGTLAHNNIAGVDREGDWATHNISHEVSALYDSTHGAALAVIFPAWMRYTLDHDPSIFAQFANRVFGVPYDRNDLRAMGLEGIRQLKAFYRRIGMPTTFGELGIEAPDLELIAEKCTHGDTAPVGRFVPLGAKQVVELLKLAL